MIDQAAPDTPPDALIDLPLQPTGSGVADLEIAYEQMKVAQGDGAEPTGDLRVIDASPASGAPYSAPSGASHGSMELIRLPIGEPAEVDTDCIRIEELEGGNHRLTGSALCVAEDEGASVSLMNGLTYPTRDEAEAAGVVWANSVGVRRLHVTVGTLDRPLRLTEIDLPG